MGCLIPPRPAKQSSDTCSKSARFILSLLPSERKEIMKYLNRFVREEDGQDMVEYALLAAFISIVAIAALRAIGPLVNAIYVRVQNALT